ncbi:PEP-CTERM sorting domain-containing protein [Kiritimatiellaeota bacterium B1221]|nr:PEP-CTERM sorting domain-containing protein [Kiritimatiellaeota bacterium B1221]
MKMMTFRFLFTTIVFFTVFAGAGASGAVIPVLNSSFESPDTGTYVNEVDDWIHGADRVAVEKANGTFPTAPDGDQWLVVDARRQSDSYEPGYVFQKIATIDETQTYTLEVVIGSRSSNSLPDNFIGGFFTDDDGVFSGGAYVGVTLDPDGALATFDKSDYPGLPDTSTATVNGGVTWNAAGSGLQGEDLYVGFYIPYGSNSSGTVKQVIYDNVVVTAVPEPSSLMLLLGGLTTVVLLIRRRS